MQFRVYGKTNEKISVLSFGLMRLPTINNKIDREKSGEILKYAIDKGITYLDTAYPYHNEESEDFLGEFLAKHNCRDKVLIATKLPSWLINSREDMDKYLNKQLEKLQTNYIDFYLVHALNKNFWENLVTNGLFEFLNTIKRDGRVKHIGFSFHDKLEVFKEIVDAYPWEFCQIQYNFLDINYQAGAEGLEYARNKGLGIAIMEPLRGGRLAHSIPDDIQKLWNTSNVKRTPAEWALKFLWDDERIDVVLSGMNSIDQVEENVSIAETTLPNCLTEDEKNLISLARDKYLSKIKVNCTGCKYCMPCPTGVDIPSCFELLNDASLFEDLEGFKKSYHNNLAESEKAHNCVECGQCESHCPQNIEIRKMLKETSIIFK